MSRAGRDDEKYLADLDELLGKITEDAQGDDEELWALRQAFHEVALPADGFVIGEPVSVTEIDYDGNERRGLTARCRREDGSEHVVGGLRRRVPAGLAWRPPRRRLSQVAGPRYLCPRDFRDHAAQRQHKATAEDLDLSGPVELIALAVKELDGEACEESR